MLSITLDPMEQIAQNSFKNFHSKGLDYLCLSRTPETTIKAYFFEGDVSKLPEVVVPHNHRYDFDSVVLAGKVENRVYVTGCDDGISYGIGMRGVYGEVYDAFDFYTPLNGGEGFVWRAQVKLALISQTVYTPRSDKLHPTSYASAFSDIHTLQIHANESVLLLIQHEDKFDAKTPSQTFRLGRGRQKPSLDGLYDKMTPDDITRRLSILERLGMAFGNTPAAR